MQPAGTVDVAPLRIAWFTSTGRVEADPSVKEATRAAARCLAECGAQVVEAVPPLLAETEAVYARLRDGDGASCIARLLERCGTQTPTSQIQARLDRAIALPGDELSAVFEDVQRLRSGMLAFMNDFDAFVCPPALHAAVRSDAASGSTYEDWAFQPAFNLTGWPVAVVRAGSTPKGLPVGVQIVAGPWREHVALAVARTIENGLGGYSPPSL